MNIVCPSAKITVIGALLVYLNQEYSAVDALITVGSVTMSKLAFNAFLGSPSVKMGQLAEAAHRTKQK